MLLIGASLERQRALKKLGDSVKIGRRGSLHGALQLIGKQGHIAYPQFADNPIHHCFKALNTLTETKWDEGNDYFSPTSFQIFSIHADPGANNVIPSSLSAKFNFRFSPCSCAEKLKERVESILTQNNLQYKMKWNLMSNPFLSPTGILLETCEHAIYQKRGIRPQPNTAGGTSDGRFLAKTGCEIVELGPLNRSIHQVNENIALQDLSDLEQIYLLILEKLNSTHHRQGKSNKYTSRPTN